MNRGMVAENHFLPWWQTIALLAFIVLSCAAITWGVATVIWPPVKLLPCAQKVIFAPQPDITPYELAQLQTKVASLALQICVAASDPIPPEMARHFRAVP